MGYLHIENLYKDLSLLQIFKELYALEKIHGTSAHIQYKASDEHTPAVSFYSGGAKHDQFVKLFDAVALRQKFEAMGQDKVIVYGEAYGGSMQGMSKTYGNSLKFIAFDVQINDVWLSVPKAEKVAKDLGLEFVHYDLIPATVEGVNAARDSDSVQAVRNGMGTGHIREGVVLRPLEELTRNNDHRVMAKHKRDEFKETATTRELDPAKLIVMNKANDIAEEWVTDQRLEHILGKMVDYSIKDTPQIINSMVEDVERESKGEVEWSKDVSKAVGTKARQLFHAKLSRLCGAS
jgi:hypothetical protein